MLSRTLAPALHLLRWTSCSANLSHGICCLALSVFMVCDCSEDGPAGCSSAWLQRQHLTCMESCVLQCSKCVSLSIRSFALAGRRPSTAGPRIRSALEYTCSNQLNQSFTQQICIGYLLCARDWARARAHSNKRNSRNPCPHGTYVQVERSRQ